MADDLPALHKKSLSYQCSNKFPNVFWWAVLYQAIPVVSEHSS